MIRFKNVMEIFKLLDKSNCRECGEKTCLAFAGAVFQGRRPIEDCPRLDPQLIAHLKKNTDKTEFQENDLEGNLEILKAKLSDLDFLKAAHRVGGRVVNDRLTLKICGKDFGVDASGRIYADIHANHWVTIPFLAYVLYGKGTEPRGTWVSFRELPGGRERAALFKKRCEEPMKQLADTLPDFFYDIIHMFSGRQVEAQFEADVAIILEPLPKVPLMICYRKPEEGMASSLSLLFDESAVDNLPIGEIFSLASGLSQMFTRLALRHGFMEATDSYS